MKTKKPAGAHVIIAQWWATTIYNRIFNLQSDLKLMGECSKLWKAAEQYGASMADLFLTVLEINFGQTALTDYKPFDEWATSKHLPKPLSPQVLLYYNPPDRRDVSWLQFVLELPEIPSVYDAEGYATWVKRYGQKGMMRGVWDGVFQYPPFRDPKDSLLPPSELAGIVGEELKNQALEALCLLESKLK